MSGGSHDLRRLLAVLEPPPGDAEAVLDRLEDAVPDGQLARALLGSMDSDRPGAQDRAIARVERWVATGGGPVPEFPWRGVGVVVAAALVLVVVGLWTGSDPGTLQTANRLGAPGPELPELPSAADAAERLKDLAMGPPVGLDRGLQGSQALSMATVAPGVTLTWTGTGYVGGTDQAPLILWDRGTLEVTRDAQAPPVIIEAGPAWIQVGGRAAVDRTPRRVRITALTGATQVRCHDQPLLVLRAGDRTDCP